MGRQGNRNERNEREGIGMRVMAIDYGDARTGVAISDATGMLAGFTTVIHGRDSQRVLEELERTDRRPMGWTSWCMGFPRNMDGTEGPRAAAIPGLCGPAGGAVPECR